MNKKKMNIITTNNVEISLCPYCGSNPIVEAKIKKEDFDNDKLSGRDVTCYCCGLNAPFDVWEAIANQFDTSILKEDE